jgi:TRAP transporter TAXI family solute receptor
MSAPAPARVTPPLPRKRSRRGFGVWLIVIGVSVAALVGTYILFVEAPPPRHLVIATGSKTGAYYRFGQRYAHELRKDGLTLTVRETKGSVENLELLLDENSGVDAAIVQSGVADGEELEQLVTLGSLYREPLWVFYRGDSTVDRLSQFAGKRIGVGPPGSGTLPVARQLLAANSVTADNATFVSDPVTDAAANLKKGNLDAAFFVSAREADFVADLLKAENVRLMSFVQAEAYHRRFRFLAGVTLPAGLLDLGRNLPPRDVSLVAPTAMLVVRPNFHPALVALFLGAATRIHGQGDELSSADEFPSPAYTDFALSDDARRYYKSGPPMLQRLLPFWMASLVDRLKVMLIPLIILLMPLIRMAPPLVQWRTRRKIYRWYAALREIDHRVSAGVTVTELDAEIERLRELEQRLTTVEVPLSYMKELFHLRLHVKMLQEKLVKLRDEHPATPTPTGQGG